MGCRIGFSPVCPRCYLVCIFLFPSPFLVCIPACDSQKLHVERLCVCKNVLSFHQCSTLCVTTILVAHLSTNGALVHSGSKCSFFFILFPCVEGLYFRSYIVPPAFCLYANDSVIGMTLVISGSTASSAGVNHWVVPFSSNLSISLSIPFAHSDLSGYRIAWYLIASAFVLTVMGWGICCWKSLLDLSAIATALN